MPAIPQNDFCDNIGAVLERAEAGEEFIVTVAGHPVARLGPVHRDQWVNGPALQRLWQTPAPGTLAEDFERLP